MARLSKSKVRGEVGPKPHPGAEVILREANQSVWRQGRQFKIIITAPTEVAGDKEVKVIAKKSGEEPIEGRIVNGCQLHFHSTARQDDIYQCLNRRREYPDVAHRSRRADL